MNRMVFFSRNWEKLFQSIPQNLFAYIYLENLIFMKSPENHSLIQIGGKNVFTNFHEGKFEKQNHPVYTKFLKIDE